MHASTHDCHDNSNTLAHIRYITRRIVARIMVHIGAHNIERIVARKNTTLIYYLTIETLIPPSTTIL
jgi:hypothetical protein